MTEKHEVWFEKWLWSYMPCHWKGVAFTAGVALAILGTIGLIHVIFDHLGGILVDFLDAFAFFAIFLPAMRIAERHSRK